MISSIRTSNKFDYRILCGGIMNEKILGKMEENKVKKRKEKANEADQNCKWYFVTESFFVY